MAETLAHIPVLPEETLQYLKPSDGGLFIDATLGAGGHTRLLLEAGVRVIGIDQDAGVLSETSATLSEYGDRFNGVHGSFGDLKTLIGDQKVDGILADIGVSSMQLDQAERGFSFQKDGPLDMRMNDETDLTAAEVVNTYSETKLVEIFSEYGEERLSKSIARAIVEDRRKQRFETTKQLSDLIHGVYLAKLGKRPFRINPATCVFQAIRIEVNDELGQLEKFLAQTPDVLKPGGRLCVIAFHSLEDRIVKQYLKSQKGLLEILTKKPVTATPEEIRKNPRSRSAKLRCAERV